MAASEQLKAQAAALKAARSSKGWSQAELLSRLRATAQRLDKVQALPTSREALLSYISYYENGKRRLPDRLRPIWRETLEASDADLGFGATDSVVLSAQAAAPRVMLTPASSLAVVSNLRTILSAHLAIEALTGPRFVIPAVLGHLPLIEELCKVSRGADRAEILRFASEFIEFCGWLYQDSGDFYCAMKVTDKALEYAMELNDAHVTSYVLMRKSNIASDNDEPGQALGLANAALANGSQLTPRLSAVALRQRANAYALLGELGEFLTSADAAMMAALDGAEQEESDRAPYCSPAYVAMETAGAWLTLGDPMRALDAISDSRTEWTAPEQGRDLLLRLSRTAVAHADAGHRDQAVQTAREVLGLVQSVDSARIVRALRLLRNGLGRWQGEADVADLRARLDHVVRSTNQTPSRPQGFA